HHFQYDDLHRLTQSSGVYGTIDFAYDKIGNLTQKTSPADNEHVNDELINLGTLTYGNTSGAQNRFGKGNNPGPHAVTSTQSGLKYDYDANGNMTSHATGDVYEWDYNNRLTHIVKDDNQAWYTYDYTGQRVSKQVRDASGDQWTSYIGKEFEIRGDNAYKYVFANGKRVARFKTDVPISAIKTQTIPLVPGWNFVAFTLEPTDPNADSVFASIQSLLTEAYTYDSKTGNYRRYAPKRLNVIGPIRAHKGYLLNVT
ncbi:MAG: hypothetical protein GY737_19925, partial [Desulfobacteraceae bacterium]|nr:hypothetical protein [Desulfobacteraceae bacterium]